MATTYLIGVDEYIHAELPSCPEALRFQSIKDTVIEFCRESLIWRYTLDAVNVQADVSEYEVDGQPSYAHICEITKVVLNSVEQAPENQYTVPYYWAVDFDSTPTAAATAGLQVEVALMPRRDLSQTESVIESCLFERYYTYFADGVLSKLMKQPDKKWSSNMWQDRHLRYRDGIRRAKIEINRGRSLRMMYQKPRWNFVV